jgi:hypothetical protein
MGWRSGQTYSEDLRARVLGAVDRGGQVYEVAPLFEVSVAFTLDYRPEVDLGNGRIIGPKALVRWQHPRRGLLGPAEFIPAAEESGLITALGRLILREACRQARMSVPGRGRGRRCRPRSPEAGKPGPRPAWRHGTHFLSAGSPGSRWQGSHRNCHIVCYVIT